MYMYTVYIHSMLDNLLDCVALQLAGLHLESCEAAVK